MTTKQTALGILKKAGDYLSSNQICISLNHEVTDRTVRRWLQDWLQQGIIEKTGNKKSSKYRVNALILQESKPKYEAEQNQLFLSKVPRHRRHELAAQIKDIWTHTSTSIEGNTLTLSETLGLLRDGLTVAGKSIGDHQEVTGHAQAIDLLYNQVASQKPLDKKFLCQLHRAVQVELIIDIYKPIGDWKINPNGCRAVDRNNQQVFIDYADPVDVDKLMVEFMNYLNSINTDQINIENAHEIYTKLHIGFVHINPFYDGNGRMARLIANVPLMRAGLPPLVIDNSRRHDYIRILSYCQIATGKLKSEVWPENCNFTEFEYFCQTCYQITRDLVCKALKT